MSLNHDDGKRSVKSSEEDVGFGQKARIVQSPGVQRIDAIASTIDLPLKIALFISIFLLSYVYGLGEPFYAFESLLRMMLMKD